MTKIELITEMAEHAGISKSAATRAINAMTSSMIKALSSGDSVYLNGLGTMKVISREERTGRNPRTGEKITLLASKTVKLLPSKNLKEAVNG